MRISLKIQVANRNKESKNNNNNNKLSKKYKRKNITLILRRCLEEMRINFQEDA